MCPVCALPVLCSVPCLPCLWCVCVVLLLWCVGVLCHCSPLPCGCVLQCAPVFPVLFLSKFPGQYLPLHRGYIRDLIRPYIYPVFRLDFMLSSVHIIKAGPWIPNVIPKSRLEFFDVIFSFCGIFPGKISGLTFWNVFRLELFHLFHISCIFIHIVFCVFHACE